MTVRIDAAAPVHAPSAGRDARPAERAGRRPDGRAADAATPRHLAGADPLRAVAALAVIVVHTAHWAYQDQGADRALWPSVILLARFCVPAFVLLTGLVLAWRYGDQRLGCAFL